MAAVLSTACSKNEEKSSQVIVNGIIELPGIIETNSSEKTLANTNVTKGVYSAPIHTAYFNPQEYIIKFNKNIDINYLKKSILKGQGRVISKISKDIYKVKLDDKNNKLMNSLQGNSLISYIEPEYLVHIQTVPNDPAFLQQQWNLKMLGLETTWNSTKGSQNVTVAVIDTGIIPDHPDLKGNITSGYDFIDHDNDPTDTDPNFSHGTHVAGIIGAVSNNQEGIAGINWNIKIMPVRVIGPGGSGGYSALIAGIYWAVDNDADIINLSLAGSIDSTSLKEAVNYAVNHNVTIVAAAGNNGSSPILYPAQYPEVISVGAIGPTRKRAYYSNFGPNLDIVAPGGDNSILGHNYNTILSTAGYMTNNTPTYQYTWAQGTSMAAPHVAGLIALLYSRGINNPRQIEQLIKDTADDLGTAGKDNEYGAGLININRALQINDRNNYNENNSVDPDKIKILATNNNTKKQLTAYTNKTNRRFSLNLSKGVWKISASTDNYSGELNISVPEDNNIVIKLR